MKVTPLMFWELYPAQPQRGVVARQDVVPDRQVDAGVHLVEVQGVSDVIPRVSGVGDGLDGVVVEVDVGVVHRPVVVREREPHRIRVQRISRPVHGDERVAADVDVRDGSSPS